MDRLEQFYSAIQTEMTVLLATAAEGRVTMRAVSPVYAQGAILIFSAADSKKYRQLQANSRCCVAVGRMFAEATAEFRGACMLPDNRALRELYCEKFPGAFDEGVEFGGRNAEFLLLHPTRLTGWAFENDLPVEGGFPTIPFDIPLI